VAQLLQEETTGAAQLLQQDTTGALMITGPWQLLLVP
jgi:hypothetical protein